MSKVDPWTKLDRMTGGGKSAPGRSPLTVAQWRKVHAARKRNVSWKDIYETVGKEFYATAGALQSAYAKWRSIYVKNGNGHSE